MTRVNDLESLFGALIYLRTSAVTAADDRSNRCDPAGKVRFKGGD